MASLITDCLLGCTLPSITKSLLPIDEKPLLPSSSSLPSPYPTEKRPMSYLNHPPRHAHAIFPARAHDAPAAIMATLLAARTRSPALTCKLDSIAESAGGWRQYLANSVRGAMESLVKKLRDHEEGSDDVQGVLREAYEMAKEAAEACFEFAEEHPEVTMVVVTLLALGMLVYIAPVALEVLGFTELGPLEGELSNFPVPFSKDVSERERWLTTAVI